MPDPALCLIAHPLTVVADVLCEALCASPRLRPLQGRTRVRVDRRSTCELGRKLDQRLGDEHGDGIEVACWASRPRRCASSGIEPPPQNGSTIGGRPIGIAARESPLVLLRGPSRRRRFPRNQALDDVEEALALALLVGFGRKRAPGAPKGRQRVARTEPRGMPQEGGEPTRDGACWGARGECSSPGRPRG